MFLPQNGLSQIVHRPTTETGISSQWPFLIQVGPYKSHMFLNLNLKDRKTANISNIERPRLICLRRKSLIVSTCPTSNNAQTDGMTQ